MEILAFALSNSSTSINHQLVKYATDLLEGHEFTLFKMIDYPFPMYSIDTEKAKGFSNSIVELANDIQKVDALLIAVNEHNGGLSAYGKNLLDWLSRFNRKFLDGKKVFLLSTSPGAGGAKSALSKAEGMLPYFGASIIDTFSLPSFYDNFSEGRITDADLASTLKEKLQQL